MNLHVKSTPVKSLLTQLNMQIFDSDDFGELKMGVAFFERIQ